MRQAARNFEGPSENHHDTSDQCTKNVDDLGQDHCGEDDVRGDQIRVQEMGNDSRCPAAAVLLRRLTIAHTTFLPENISLVQDKGLTDNSQLPASTVQGMNSSTSLHRCRHSRPSPSTPYGEIHSAQQSAPEIHGLRPMLVLARLEYQGGGT